MSDSPIVGITKPEDDDNLAYAAIALAVRMAGGTPERLTSGMSWREAAVDALIIGGGSDIFPPHYDQEAIEGAHYDHGRDEMEMFWARTARDFKPSHAGHLPWRPGDECGQWRNTPPGP